LLPATLTLDALRAVYLDRPDALIDVVEEVLARIASARDPAIFISLAAPDELLRAARDLLKRAPDPALLPLWGIPFAVKDNIDVAGLDTTAACPAFAYRAEKDATTVARLKAAGALAVGKTNLDQFATGLNGTRSPYGAPRSVFHADYVSGGSSSGSAVAVAAGLVPFALGTDTAGSGRVPAAFNNIVGIKPTPGLLSAAGVVPACWSLDCVSIFSASVADGVLIRRLAEGFDQSDPYSVRGMQKTLAPCPRVGVLGGDTREFYGDEESAALYAGAIETMRGLGAEIIAIDYRPFQEIGALLYDGPWLAERLAGIGDFVDKHPQELYPAVRTLLEGAHRYSAVEAFAGMHKLRELRRRCEIEWAAADFLLLPTSPAIYTVEAMRADPLKLNARLGTYTNFVNFLGCSAIAVPAGFKSDGLPFGVTLVAPPFHDDALAIPAAAMHAAANCGAGRAREKIAAAPVAVPGEARVGLAVVGAHLTGEPLNAELAGLGGWLIETIRTAGDYRLFVLANTTPRKPGLVRDPKFRGEGIEVEVWSLSPEAFGRFAASIPAPLGIGKIALADGREVSGFLCEGYAVEGAHEITHFGGWRGFLRR
jgi:allophanate hydrolase